MTCDPLSEPQNGDITYSRSAYATGQYPLQTEASLTCDYGFSQSGPSSITCQIPGQWTFLNPDGIQSNEINSLLKPVLKTFYFAS